MKTRIKELRKLQKMTQAEFAKRIGLTQSTVAGYETGAWPIPASTVLAICREFGVSEEWLRTGQGEMYRRLSREEETQAMIDSLFADRPEAFRSKLLRALLTFEPESPMWEWLEEFARRLAEGKEPLP